MHAEPLAVGDVADTPESAKERLLAAAEDIFADYGYEGASVRAICSRAGMNVAAVNYHFGDKERLYIEAVKRAHSCSAKDMPVENLAPPGTPPLARLEGFIRGMVASMHTPTRPSAMKLMMREMADPGKAAGVVVDEFIRPLAFHLRAILRELLPHLDEHRLLMTGFSVIAQCLYYRQNRPLSELIFSKGEMEALTVGMVADHVVGFTMRAVGMEQNKRHADDADGRADQRG